MKYLLIDTATIKKSLIAKSKFSNSLKQLDLWCKEGTITLLYPETLKLEWEKHQVIELDKLRKSISDIKSKLSLLKASIPQNGEDLALESLEGQIHLLNKLFLNHSRVYSAESALYKTMYEQKTNSKAPFHSKQASDNDFLIFASSINEAIDHGIEEFHFITANSNDYGDSSDKENKLHPELISLCGNIKVNYFSDFTKLSQQLIKSGLSELINQEEDSNNSIPKKQNNSIIELKDENHTLSILHSHFQILFQDLKSIPYDILNKLLLSRIDTEIGFSPYKLDTVSELVYKVLSNVETDKKGKIKLINDTGINDTIATTDQTKFLIEKLQSQSVYYITCGNKKHSLPEIIKEDCQCSRCRFHFFDFKSMDLNFRDNDESDFVYTFKKAFTLFKIGNFKDAIDSYYECLDIAKKENNEINIFRTKYNLLKLKTSIYNHHFFDDETGIDFEKLKSIELDEINRESNNELVKEVIRWMSNDHYIKDAYHKMSEINKKIISNYFTSYNGGMSSNGSVNELGFEYAQIRLFLENNCIIYENFTEFRQIVNCFMEAMIASYATNNNSSRVTAFNDWTLIQLLKFGEFDTIKSYATKYKIKKIQYKSSNKKGKQITDIILNLFQQIEIAEKSLTLTDQYAKRLFKNKYRTWLNNAFSILWIMDFEPVFIKKCFKLIPKLITNTDIQIDQYKLISMLVSKSDMIDVQLWKSILLAAIKNKNKTVVHFYHMMTEIAIDYNLEISFNDREFKEILSKLKDNTPTNDFCSLHIARATSNKDQQKELVEIFENHFKNPNEIKIGYCLGLVHGMIKPNDDYLNQLIIQYSPVEPIKSPRNNFHGYPNYNGNLDFLIEALFKLELDLTEERFKNLNNHGIYYQWLLNLDTFDYSKFDPEWILCYIRKSYTKRFARCIPLKQAIENYIISPEQTNKTTIQERYFAIYLKN